VIQTTGRRNNRIDAALRFSNDAKLAVTPSARSGALYIRSANDLSDDETTAH
jgi:hypothetical protein